MLKLVDLINASIFTGLDDCDAVFRLLLRKDPFYVADPVLTNSKKTITINIPSHQRTGFLLVRDELKISLIIYKAPGGSRHS
jgi:hypothetical protein